MAGRILVLDDEENYAEMLQDLLRENNYRVDMATRPERAIVQLEEIPYDLVISDYKMPVMDGADFLKKARELYPNLPFILVSGLMNTPELVKVANMSVTLVMEKPLDTEVFLAHVARFSEPMTDEERADLEREASGDSGSAPAASFPQEPRFFCARNFLTERVLADAWNLAQNGFELYVLEPAGGDASLLLKDLSQWLGCGDRPIEFLDLPDSKDAAVGVARGILADADKSQLIGFRLASVGDIPRAHHLTVEMQLEDDLPDSCLFAFVLSGETEVQVFQQASDGRGIVLPPMALRPSDLATYARRLARIASEKSGRKGFSKWDPEAIFALLAYDWPLNYEQLHEVIPAVIDAAGDQPISFNVFTRVLEQSIEVPEAKERMAGLMHAHQTRFLKNLIQQEAMPVDVLAKKLNLAESLGTSVDLEKAALIDAKYGSVDSPVN